MDRRTALKGALVASVAPTAALASNGTPDPVLALCAEHDHIFKRFTDAVEAWERGKLTDEEMELIADPAWEAASAITDRIASTQATTREGLLAQYDHFLKRMGTDLRDAYCDKWSAILDTMRDGLQALT